MIRSRLAILLAEKGHREGRKLTYRIVAAETKLSQGVLVRLNSQDFGRVDTDTLDTLCIYFGCTVCDILEHVEDATV
jgi:putative transcriptional regulator